MPSSRYKFVTSEKAGGATYTPDRLADFVAEEMLRVADLSKVSNGLRVLDPAAGDGELLLSLLARLPETDGIEAHGFETDAHALNVAGARIKQRFPNIALHLHNRSFLDFVLERVRPHDLGGLFESAFAPSYDLIIANPPYVRTQIMGAEQAQRLAQQFGLAGRVDLYYAFIIGMALVLKPGGIGGIIVSNRFMTTKSGGAVRQAIREHFNVQHVWDLGDTKLFDAAVLPAVLLVEKQGRQRQRTAAFTSIYSTTTHTPMQDAADVIAALACDGTVRVDDGRCFTVKNGQLDISVAADAVWRVANVASDGWLSTVEAHTWRRFGDIGKIRVGVKTCADKVFIRSDWETMPDQSRPELLRPLTTHHVARQFRARTPEKPRQILYPHEGANGERRASDLARFPKSRDYLEQHRAALERRSYVVEGGRQWYEIWVPQDPEGWTAPKLVFRDISDKPTFWLDLDGTIVNGDCYWLSNEKPDELDLLWLAAAVANSTFIEEFYDHSFNNKLYSGRRRYITQYVERFPLPRVDKTPSRTIIALAKRLYEGVGTEEIAQLTAQVDKLVWEAFGVGEEEVAR
jgi:adenine-specific DNA-methyltransferase